MNFEAYLSYFENVLQSPEQYETYKDPQYLHYTKLNWSRNNRWLKKFVPTEEVKSAIEGIQEKQHWIVITEPWCGDAAHSVPQIAILSALNPLINLEIQLRDEEPFLIDQYLTNGGKSIPKLIIRNEQGDDIAVWGPRPAALQKIFYEMKEEGKSFDDIKEVIQKWYNEDKGVELSKELIALLS